MSVKKKIEGNGMAPVEIHKLSRLFIEEDGTVGGVMASYYDKDSTVPVTTKNPKFDQSKLRKAVDDFKAACYAALDEKELEGGVEA